MSKSEPRPCFEEMTVAKWQEFDRRLEERLKEVQGMVEITEKEMGAHYDRVTACM